MYSGREDKRISCNDAEVTNASTNAVVSSSMFSKVQPKYKNMNNLL